MSHPHPKTLPEFAHEEREFLHELSNPLAIAAGMLEAYQMELERTGVQPSEGLARKLAKLENALERISALIKDHRARLIEIGEKS